ncbi:hypothetical protein [Maritimibacter alkaliphilus]|uniref:hypothetical protein n=1 Tax=Maritimibacter alkaliphilus TaxID=404236 RepID=UPI001C963525|nr:hypothetical protein [Maritimibacter alkaliphilus]MBY6091054.1 hypothetical protein [Maritimibacter alkaliphilus]
MRNPLRPHVTDHALVRYMERVMELDLGPIRAEISKLVEPAIGLSATALRHEGYRYILVEERVVTIMPCSSETVGHPSFEDVDDG